MTLRTQHTRALYTVVQLANHVLKLERTAQPMPQTKVLLRAARRNETMPVEAKQR